MESVILDFLCLDEAKSLIRVPLCALKAIQMDPAAFNLDDAIRHSMHRYGGYKAAAYQSS